MFSWDISSAGELATPTGYHWPWSQLLPSKIFNTSASVESRARYGVLRVCVHTVIIVVVDKETENEESGSI